MKTITQSPNKERWPRMAITNVEARKSDLIIRIADWSRDRDEPAYDVECYIGGVYDWNESKSHTKFEHGSMAAAKAAAIAYAKSQIERLL